MKIIARISRPGSKHLYECYVKGGVVQVEATNGAQALRIAEKNGYDVNSVNMVG